MSEHKVNAEVERAVLGSVLCQPDLADRVSLEAEEFGLPGHREIWAAILRLRKAGKPSDVVSVCDELERAGKFQAIDFSQLIAGRYDSDNIEWYADIVARDSYTRKIRYTLAELMGGSLEGDELIGRALRELSALIRRNTKEARSMRLLTEDVYRYLGKLVEGDGHEPGLPTGLLDLDSLIGQIQYGVVTVVGGRTSTGKSSLARTIADNVSADGRGVHVFSLEDSARAYTIRVLADQARIELQRLKSPKDLTKPHLDALMAASERVRRDHWIVDDSAGLSVAQIALRVRRAKQKLKTKLVVVDYVQLLAEKGRDLREKLVEAMTGLVTLAREEDVALIAVSQVNRDNEKENRRPRLGDLKESGSIEETADAVLLVHRRDADANKKDDKGEAGVVVAKNKNGPTGWVALHWDGPCATWRNARRY